MDGAEYSLEELLACVNDPLTQAGDDEGYRSSSEWATYWGRGITVTRKAIARLLEAGVMEAKERRAIGALDGRNYRLMVYRINEEKYEQLRDSRPQDGV